MLWLRRLPFNISDHKSFAVREIALERLVVEPFLVDPQSLILVGSPLERRHFEINLSLKDGIEKLRLDQLPPFVQTAHIVAADPVFQVAKLAGTLHELDGGKNKAGRFQLSFQSESESAGESVWQEYELAVTTRTELPFRLSRTSLNLGQTDFLSILPVGQMQLAVLQIDSWDSSLTGVDCIVEDATKLIVSRSPDASSDADAGYVRLHIDCGKSNNQLVRFVSHVPLILNGNR